MEDKSIESYKTLGQEMRDLIKKREELHQKMDILQQEKDEILKRSRNKAE